MGIDATDTDQRGNRSTLPCMAMPPNVGAHLDKHPIDCYRRMRYSQSLQGPEFVEDPAGQGGQRILVKVP